MVDIVDRFIKHQEEKLEEALEKVAQYKPPPFSGFCLHCEEPIGNRRFCDRYCRESYEKQSRRNR